MAAAQVAYPAAGVVYNWANVTIDFPIAHAFNTQFGILGSPNAAVGTVEHPVLSLQGLAFSLTVRNPNNAAELDNTFYGIHGIDIPAILTACAQAVNAGFNHGVLAQFKNLIAVVE